MSVKTYHKLVRDRIPEIIEASGKTCVTEILSDEAYLKMLDKKLDEELAEYRKDQNVEELADLLEVIRACAVARGYSVEELEQVRTDKAAKRGGFEKKILLREVSEKADYSFILKMREYLLQKNALYSNTSPHLVQERIQGRRFSFEEHIKGLIYSQL
ncbi:MAG: nucleoside triphosphate pyrophosphohydrolase, partial [Oscillospiraceae bacterium]